MAHVIGIDLGTVNSCVAAIVDGIPTVIPDEHGRHLTPSIYAVSATGEPVAGHDAEAQMLVNGQNTIFAVKRFIGLKYDTDEVRTAAKKLPYKIVAAKNGDAWVEIDGKSTSPEEVSAAILLRLKHVAEHYFKERVTHAVITVPAHFNDAQRQATRDAARIAGLDVLRVLNEPTAAALAYGLGASQSAELVKRHVGLKQILAEKVVAVFDLGGGTFDVSILALRDGVFDVLSTHGDTYLGGEDFDLEIVKYVVEQFRLQTRIDISQNRDLLQKLKVLARQAKHTLSASTHATIEIPYVTAQDHLSITLDRKTFEKLALPIISRLTEPCLAAMEDAGIEPRAIDEVILVGGMTRVPSVKKLCRQVFGREPIDTVDADEAVAVGAAIQAGILHGLLKGVALNDVTSLSLGIETQGGTVHTLLARNTKIPTKVSETFTTSSPNQPQVSIHLVQGESNFAPDNMSLGRFELTGIRPSPRGVPQISVELDVDGDGIVHIAARDLGTGQKQALEIVASSGLDERQIDTLLRQNIEAQRHKDRMAQGRDSVTPASADELERMRQELRAAIFMTQFKLDVEGKNFKGDARYELEQCLLSARDVLDHSIRLEDLQNNLSALGVLAAVLDKFLDHN